MATTETKPVTTTDTAPAKKAEPIITQVQSQVASWLQDKRLNLPPDYSVGNALQSAWLKLREDGVIKNGQVNTDLVTETSVIAALQKTAVQGLNPGKDQCYYIKYGTALTMQRSYHGDIRVAQVSSAIKIEPYYDVVCEGEKVVLRKVRNRYGYVTVVADHEFGIVRDMSKIVAAYCGFVDENGEDMGAEIMSVDQIQTSWKKSKMYSPGKEGTFHTQQPDRACIRTVVRRRCLQIIRTSGDPFMVAESFTDDEATAIEAEFREEVNANANREPLSLEPPTGEGQIQQSAEPQGSLVAGDDFPE